MTSSSTTIIVVFLVYLVVIVLLSMLKTKYLPGRAIYLLRAVFPSWRFFEDLSELPVLYHRVSSGTKEFGDWQRSLRNNDRSLSAIVFNPDGNLLLACHGLLQQVENDMQSVEDGEEERFLDSVSYKLLKNLVRRQITDGSGDGSEQISKFQFKVTSLMQGAEVGSQQDILVSPEHEF